MTQSPTISFEFFPPKTDRGKEKLRNTRRELAKLNPEFYSVTFGAGGSTRDGTLETVREIKAESSIDAVPHLSCVSSTRENISELLQQFKASGINHLVCLRGDIPSGMVTAGEFNYANELISFIRQETGDLFHIEVAAYPEVHPETNSADTDSLNFKRKVESGANSAITQYFYNIDAYFYFIERCQKLNINIPIVPGIMPITNYEQLARFSAGCGAEIPRWLDRRLSDFGDDLASIRAFGIDFVTDLCQRLINQGAPGLHFYTLNQYEASTAICAQLDLKNT